MRNWLTFNGTDCRDYGVYISGQGTFSAPARSYDFASVPGRNGDLIISGNRMENLELTYPAFAYANFRESMRGFRSFLLSQIGYKRLIDTYHPDEYRMACYTGPFEPEMLKDNRAGSFELTFMCKPQRFLLSGEITQAFESNGSIYNPTLFDAQPLLRIYGDGSVTIGSSVIIVEPSRIHLSYVDIDCAMMDAYNGATTCNPLVTVVSADHDFPVLPPGETGITLTGVTRVEIIPRWWQL